MTDTAPILHGASPDDLTLTGALGLSRDRSILARGVAAAALGRSAWQVGRALQNVWRQRHTFTVSVQSDDPLYRQVQDWLVELVAPDDRHALLARSGAVSDVAEADHAASDEDNNDAGTWYDPSRGRLRLDYHGGRERGIRVDGHQVLVRVHRAEDAEVVNGRIRMVPDEIRFVARSHPAQEAVISHLRKLAASYRRVRRPALHVMDKWGQWVRRADLPLRSLDTVVLADGQIERLTDDLTRFLAAEDDYGRLGMPWHRGYLFHGPPGVGKTSIVRALSAHFGLDLWYAPLGDLTADASLLQLVSQVQPRSVLLLEDVDVYHAATSRDDAKDRLSLSGLLNSLDGVATPHGLISMLTTNDRTALDEAVTRPGRIDVQECFTVLDDARLGRLYEVVYGRAPTRRLDAGGRSPAALVEVLKAHLHDPEAAEAALAGKAQMGVAHHAFAKGGPIFPTWRGLDDS